MWISEHLSCEVNVLITIQYPVCGIMASRSFFIILFFTYCVKAHSLLLIMGNLFPAPSLITTGYAYPTINKVPCSSLHRPLIQITRLYSFGLLNADMLPQNNRAKRALHGNGCIPNCRIALLHVDSEDTAHCGCPGWCLHQRATIRNTPMATICCPIAYISVTSPTFFGFIWQ